jgi:predicted RNase H-like HicB family nuclease
MLVILAHWDAEARVWWAQSDEIPGLVAEATTLDTIIENIKHIVPELLQLNGMPNPRPGTCQRL